MLEHPIEQRLRTRLEERNFLVLKLKTPGRRGVMDRMILRPVYWPGPPMFVELKRPGATPRKIQEVMAADWRRRGVEVLEYCDTIAKVDALCDNLLKQSYDAWQFYIPEAGVGTVSYK